MTLDANATRKNGGVTLVVRAARQTDVPALAPIERAGDALFVSVGHTEFAGGAVIVDDEARRAVAEGRITVAEVDGIVVGWLGLSRMGDELSIHQVSVDPAHGRRGIGSSLMRQVIDSCTEATLVLDTQADVAWNRPWYEKFGFVIVDPAEWTTAMRQTVTDQTNDGLSWSTRVHMRRSVAPLAAPMHQAMRLAWESFRAGSLGIGAVVTRPDGTTVATGRNRLSETDPGDDVLANTSLAHAEMNALAKLRWGAHRDDGLQLWTTLQPCLQCLGAIRLADIDEVHQLSPDPLWVGIEGVRDLNPFLARRWPIISQRPIDAWAALSILMPTFAGVFWDACPPGWVDALPSISGLARDLVDSGELFTAVSAGHTLDQVAAALWERLGRTLSDLH